MGTPFKDGDWISITFDTGQHQTAQFTEHHFSVATDGTPQFSFYIYEPDGCTDTVPWSRIVSIKHTDLPDWLHAPGD